MTEWEIIIFTAVATIIGGTVIYLIGQVLSKTSIDPSNELKKAIAEVRFTLSFFAPIIMTPVARNEERSTEAARALREKSAELMALVELAPSNRVLRFLSYSSLPPEQDIIGAAVHLRAVSTYMHEKGEKAADSLEEIQKRIKKIEELLALKTKTDT